MPIWLQFTIVGLVIAAAVVHLARTLWRWMHKPAGACGGGCGCDAPPRASSNTGVALTIHATSDAAQRGAN